MQPGSQVGGPGWYRPAGRRPTHRIAIVMLGLVFALMVSAVGYVWVSVEGGPEAIWLNSLPAPDQDKPEVVQKRAAARSTAEAALATLEHTSWLTKGPRSYSAACERGQNNWKMHQGYQHTCDVSVAGFYGWTGGFPEMARRLHQELVADGWTTNDYNSLTSAAEQYETGTNRYSRPTPGVSPGPIDFEDGWSAGYEKGDHSLSLRFADTHTTDVRSFDYSQHKGRSGWSWSDTRETVDSAATVRALLADSAGVLFADTREPYFSIPE